MIICEVGNSNFYRAKHQVGITYQLVKLDTFFCAPKVQLLDFLGIRGRWLASAGCFLTHQVRFVARETPRRAYGQPPLRAKSTRQTYDTKLGAAVESSIRPPTYS